MSTLRNTEEYAMESIKVDQTDSRVTHTYIGLRDTMHVKLTGDGEHRLQHALRQYLYREWGSQPMEEIRREFERQLDTWRIGDGVYALTLIEALRLLGGMGDPGAPSIESLFGDAEIDFVSSL